MKKIALYTLLALSLVSCKMEEKKAQPTLMKEVMQVHDAVMPKMGTIGKLVKVLNEKKDSLLLLNNHSLMDQRIKDYSTGVDSLQKAHKKMMTWMKDFGAHFTADEILKGKALSLEKQRILEEQAIKVKEMESAILGSIEYAKRLSIE